ncbi:hypothetical protein [Pedobacter duraquae]|nr:hypothetical protein [Pedobacter duraquae]
MEHQLLFTEKQRFNQWWLWLILLAVNGVALYSMYNNGAMQQSSGNIQTWLSLGIPLLVTVLIFTAKLETRITQDGIYVRFFPFHLTFRQYTWDKIQNLSLRKYSPIMEYGGWGIRYSGNGWAFNTTGNMGLQLEFPDNKKLLIGTKKADDMKRVLEKMSHVIYTRYNQN